jgi:hypothetical protein
MLNRGSEDAAMRRVINLFRYAPMTPEEQDRWQSIRSAGLFRYILKQSPLDALFFISFWVISDVVISKVTGSPLNLKSSLISDALFGALMGLISTLYRWEGNRRRSVSRPPKGRRLWGD